MEKEEIARHEQFLLFPKCFLLNQKIVLPFLNIYDIISLFAAELEELKIGIWGKGLIAFHNYWRIREVNRSIGISNIIDQ